MLPRRLAKMGTAAVRDTSGASAVEFALILPSLCLLIFAIVNLSMLMMTTAGLHYATQSASRYASIYTNVHGAAPADVQAFGAARYKGMTAAAPVFTLASAACGSQVTATVTYKFITGLFTLSVPMTAVACRAT